MRGILAKLDRISNDGVFFPQTVTMTARELWDAALTSRIDKLEARLRRHDGIERYERLDKLIAGIEARKLRFESRLYENLSADQQGVVDRLSPPGKVRARACSNRPF